MRGLVTLLCAALAAASALPDEDWGYTEVRPGAHVFWWLFKGDKADDAGAPFLVWQQGGPGASSTGFGNFLEVGPLDVNLQPRNTTWVKSSAALLFVDGPVGTGFSYVDSPSLLTRSNAELAADYIKVLEDVTSRYNELTTAPAYIFSESFGGHMNPAYAVAALDAIDKRNLSLNLTGIALGDSWVSGVSYTNTWVPYLRSLSVLDERDATALQPTVDAVAKAVSAGQWEEATNLWGSLEDGIMSKTDDVDWYFALSHHVSGNEMHDRSGRYSTLARKMPRLARRQLAAYHADSLSTLMNGPIRTKLNGKPGFSIPSNVTWGGQAGEVFSALSVEFMKDISPTVDSLLKGGRIGITVYNGAVDLICCTPGTESWMKTLTWSGMQDFYAAGRTPVYPRDGDEDTGAFYKHAQGSNLAMYYLTRSGHMCPGSPSIGGMPDTMLRIMERVTGQRPS